MDAKREVELQLEVWRERQGHVQTSAHALNMQSQLLKHQAKECQTEIARLEATLATMAASDSAAKESGNAAPGQQEAIPTVEPAIAQAGAAPA